MQTAKIEITIKRGDRVIPLKFKAYEVLSASGYGRDRYVDIQAVDENGERDFKLLDVRYINKYNFFNLLLDEFTAMYGNSIQTFSVEFDQ